MANFVTINLGIAPNDGQGDPLRRGGSLCNINFREANDEKLEAGGYLLTGQDLFNSTAGLETRTIDILNKADLGITQLAQFPSDNRVLVWQNGILINTFIGT